jgi:transcriptional regulator with XRE-family HTH domain
MPLRTVDIMRLEKFKRDLESLRLRFPIAELAGRMKADKGNISAYLSGKKPVSEKFLQRFYDAFSLMLPGAGQEVSPEINGVEESDIFYETNAGLRMEINQLREETMLQLQKIEMCLREFRLAINAMNAMIRRSVNEMGAATQPAGKSKAKTTIKKKIIERKGKPSK